MSTTNFLRTTTDAGVLVSTVRLALRFETMAFFAGDECGVAGAWTEEEARAAHAAMVARFSGNGGALRAVARDLARGGCAVSCEGFGSSSESAS